MKPGAEVMMKKNDGKKIKWIFDGFFRFWDSYVTFPQSFMTPSDRGRNSAFNERKKMGSEVGALSR